MWNVHLPVHVKFSQVALIILGFLAFIFVILTVPWPRFHSDTLTSSKGYESIKPETKRTPNPIHLAVIITGSRSFNQALTMFKSIFLSMGRWDREACPADEYISDVKINMDPIDIVFHLLIDDPTYSVLWPTLRQWYLRRVSFHFYQLQKYGEDVKDLRNAHYGGNATMVKLVIAQIIPAEVEKIIVLDSDLLFLSNINELWSYFDNFDENHVFGMAAEQNPYYRFRLGRFYWPRLNYGYNAGLILIHLGRLRRLPWNMMWRRNSELLRSEWKRLLTGEQDIYNTVFQSNRRLIYRLPCNWNFQLSLDDCEHLCPVVWPSVNISTPVFTNVSGKQPVDLKVAHFNRAMKPEDYYWRIEPFPDPRQDGVPLTRVQVMQIFSVVYYSLRDMSMGCFW